MCHKSPHNHHLSQPMSLQWRRNLSTCKMVRHLGLVQHSLIAFRIYGTGRECAVLLAKLLAPPLLSRTADTSVYLYTCTRSSHDACTFANYATATVEVTCKKTLSLSLTPPPTLPARCPFAIYDGTEAEEGSGQQSKVSHVVEI